MPDAQARSGATLIRLLSVLSVAITLTLAVQGCGPTTIEETDAGTVMDAGPTQTDTLHPDAKPLPGESACEVVITTGITVGSAQHLAFCTGVLYETNPPSGGDHWGTWAAFKEYSTPVPREMYVHSMEHGAVVLAYRCKESCPDIQMMLHEVFAEAASDSLCLSTPGNPPKRLVLTPDPELPTPIAAAAWGATYTATCIDKASLTDFVKRVYGRGPEQICSDGADIEDPNAGLPTCGTGSGS